MAAPETPVGGDCSPPPHELVGYVFKPWQTSVNPARQHAFHAALGLDEAAYAGRVDPSVLANDCLHGARPRDALGDKRLHVGVRPELRRPVPLGTPLTVHARVAELTPVRRGRMITIDFDFAAPDGDIPISIAHQSLILDPTGPGAAPPDRARPSAPDTETRPWEPLGTLELTPRSVSAYSFEFPHLDGHHSAEAAASIGLRAQIAQGLMLFTAMFGAFARARMPDAVHVAARFLRPAFADETLRIEGVREQGGLLRTVQALNAQGKPAASMDILARQEQFR